MDEKGAIWMKRVPDGRKGSHMDEKGPIWMKRVPYG